MNLESLTVLNPIHAQPKPNWFTTFFETCY